jgi:glycosyltransferase involved in cell wall biosynthesis
MNSKVSVIVTCYNQGIYLRDTIESVLKQTYENLEIILVDDGSTDSKTLKILSTNSWERTQLIKIKNSGVSAARNLGIERSTGDYILILDGDDLIESTFVEKAVLVLDSDFETKVVCSRVKFIGKKRGELLLPDFSIERLLVQNTMVITSMFRKSEFYLTNGFNSNMNEGFEDWDFWISLLKRGGKVYKINELLFLYRIRSKSRTSFISTEIQNKLRRQLYDNHKDIYGKTYLNPLWTVEYQLIKNSMEFRIGSFLFSPVRFLYRIIQFF